jgi:hypothetical protein
VAKAKPRRDEEREHRITMEIVVGACADSGSQLRRCFQ